MLQAEKMGLDAVVYRNVANLLPAEGREGFEVDDETGEIYAKVSNPLPMAPNRAASERLGNIDAIDAIRDAVSRVLPNDSLILTRVLYSATHCGDHIATQDIDRLHDEVLRLQAVDDPLLKRFANSLESLITAARAEQNPIVFV